VNALPAIERFVVATVAEGIRTLQAGIFPENTPSLAVHCRCGFREVGRRERLGKPAGAWRDVLLPERRGPKVGTE
jgi:phosphinothricin acetyltransferase